MAQPSAAPLRNFRIYDSKDAVFVVGSSHMSEFFGSPAAASGTSHSAGDANPHGAVQRSLRLLRFDKRKGSEPGMSLGDIVEEDPRLYSTEEMESRLQSLAGKSKRSAFTRLSDVVAIIGCVRFVRGFYLVVISNRVEEGKIDRHTVYSSRGGDLIPLFDPDVVKGKPARRTAWSIFTGTQDPTSAVEEELLNLFKLVDLSKAFYFSYTYDLCISLQRNAARQVLERANAADATILQGKSSDRFVWNHFLAAPLLAALPSGEPLCRSPWIVSLMHGSFRQQRLSVYSRSLTLTLVARRSRHFAGTRYLKRGVNDQGDVANDVEIEQIVQDHMNTPGAITAFLQVRGSIPTFWSQETSVATPKPPIKRQRFDPWYTASRLHFANLMERYGESILVLNLVKQIEQSRRETIVGNDFKHAVEHLNSTLPSGYGILYRAVDFTRLIKADKSSLRQALDKVAKQSIDTTSFFTSEVNCLRFGSLRSQSCASVSSASFDNAVAEWLRLSFEDSRQFALRKRRGNASKLPMRWSAGKRSFVPMRTNMVFSMYAHAGTSRQLQRISSESTIPEPQASREEPETPDNISEFTSLEIDVPPGWGVQIGGSPAAGAPGSLESPAGVAGHMDASFLNDHNEYDDDDVAGDCDYDEGHESEDYDPDEIEYESLFRSRASIGTSMPPSSPGFAPATPMSMSQPLSPRRGRPAAATGRVKERIQRGIVRTNCIDCLDRTNLAQFLIGLHVLNEQLQSIGVLGKADKVGTDSKIATVFIEMYEELGDRLALQYAGSDAHRKGGKLMTGASSSSRQKSIYTSLKRYYSNSFTDYVKQDAINVFLGTFRQEHHHKMAQQQDQQGRAAGKGRVVETQHARDFYLHNHAVTQDPNYSLEPLSSELESWWIGPLESFARQVLLPLRALSAQLDSVPFISSALADDEPGLTSFKSLFTRPYFQPVEIGAGHSTPSPISRVESLSSESLRRASPRRLRSPALRNRPNGRKLRSWSSAESAVSDASVASSVYRITGSFVDTASRVGRGFESDALEEGSEETGSMHTTMDSFRIVDPSSTSHDMEFLAATRLDPISRDYLQAIHQPFEMMFESPFATQGACESSCPPEGWDRLEHEKEYRDALAEYNIKVDDGWGMRRLQAYSCVTSIVMYGPYKGYPRSLQASALSHIVDPPVPPLAATPESAFPA